MIKKMVKGIRIAGQASAVAMGAAGGGGIGYAVSTATMGTMGQILALMGMGSVSILSAPVLASAVVGAALIGGTCALSAEVRGIERVSDLRADEEGFEDGPQ